jgi:hypothetical protein
MRYHFNIRDAEGLVPDDEGSELSGLSAARAEAHASAMDFAMDDLRGGRPIRSRCIEITDENGSILESMSVPIIVGTKAP